MIKIYTDGTVTKNPGGDGRGGWVIEGETEVHLTKIFKNTTNNQMEFAGALDALLTLPPDSEIEIYTDSLIMVKASKKFNPNKLRKHDHENKVFTKWKTCLYEAIRLHKKVDFIWVKAHNGDYYNELVDDAIRISPKKKKLWTKIDGKWIVRFE